MKKNTDAPECDPNPGWSAVVLYDSAPSGSRAVELLRTCAGEDDRSPSLSIHLWRYDVLLLPEVQQQARDQIESASVILFAAQGEEDVPADAVWWICDMILEKPRVAGLVCVDLIHDSPAEENADGVLDALECAVRSAGMDFLRSRPSPEDCREACRQNRQRECAPASLPMVPRPPMSISPFVVQLCAKDAASTHAS